MAGEPVAVEVLLHGERGAQQPNRCQPGPGHHLRGGVAQVQQRNPDPGLDLVGDLVHRVGAEK